MLTDNVLVEIFDFCRKDHDQCPSGHVWKWHLLVHVCRRWRQIIFASPRRLHLEILCTDGTPVRKNLGIWPAIPIVMQYGLQDWDTITFDDEDNIIAALEHPDRICRARLYVTESQLGRITAVMQEPFPVLTCLSLYICISEDENVPVGVIPSGFLAGSAPRLQEIELDGIPFPALPTLLLSASDLVTLRLCDTPTIGYISPEVMVAHLAALPKLKLLDIEFKSDSLPGRTLLPLMTRTVLPALKHSVFCVCEYSEDFLARIDAPQLCCIEIYYVDEAVVDFAVPQLTDFINRSENLKRTLSKHCQIIVDDIEGIVDLYIGGPTDNVTCLQPETGICVYFLCNGMDRKFLQLTSVLSRVSPILSHTIHFAIIPEGHEPSCEPSLPPDPSEELNNIEWLQVLRQFSSVQTLFVAAMFAGYVSRALEDIAEVTATEVLPALELLCLEDQPMSSVDRFIAIRRDSGRLVTIVGTKEEFEKRLEAYPP
ncbi:hypothetical protein EDB89DRAFT_2244339 [Lactarius sanguifluus]|nr:hypothetical protein EDB89DRAFT_2244339 [Lactarius sanguifluus]